MKYRPEIDGLRTIAVLPVILFHAGFTQFSGGFVGVDVFFVISGYLITTILIGELDRGDFSILRFYERRARRILPALFVVIACTVPMAWIQLDPVRFTDFSESIIAAMLFASNFLFWMESGYFDLDAENKPLLHTWSLAVEEQYYVFFPIMLFFLWRLGRRSALGTIIALTVVSFGLCLWAGRAMPSANFYLLPFRMWELFVGSICAFLVTRPQMAQGHQALAGLGLAAVLASIFLIDDTMVFPGVVTLGPVLGTALIILFARPGTWTATLLSLKPMVWIGLISYSLYLWHQPILAIARLRFGHDLPVYMMAGLIIASIVLAYLTWRFIEAPFRKTPTRAPVFPRRGQVFAASGAAMVAFAGFGVFGIASDGAAQRFPAGYATLLAGYEDRPPEDCRWEPAHALPSHPEAACIFPTAAEPSPTVMILGDSHAWTMSQEMQRALNEAGYGVYVATHIACLPVPELYTLEGFEAAPDRCPRFMADALDWAETTGIAQIVLIGRYSIQINGSPFDNQEGGVEVQAAPEVDTVWTRGALSIPPREERVARLLDGIPARLAALSERFDLIVLEQVPEAGWHVPSQGMRLMQQSGEVQDLSTSYAVYQERQALVQDMLDRVIELAPGRVERVRTDDLFCDAETGRCDNIRDGVPLYYDDDHLSNAGTRLVAPRVVAAVTALRDRAGQAELSQ